MRGLLFGSDPEFAIVDEKGKPVSAIKLMRQFSKESKMQIGNQSIFWDNVLLEMNLQPAQTFQQFHDNFKECLDGTQKFLSSLGPYSLKAQASLNFPQSELEDLEAKVFGCEPEYCIYNRNEEGKILRVAPPELPEGSTFRSCGGHIHIGHMTANWEFGGKPDKVIELMDGIVGTASVLIDTPPASVARRKIYGGAGSHRVTSYGVEYRTPSNFWLTFPELTKLIYRLTRLVVEYALTDPDVVVRHVEPAVLQETINKGNVSQALQIFKDISKHFPFEIQQDVASWAQTKNTEGVSLTDAWHDFSPAPKIYKKLQAA